MPLVHTPAIVLRTYRYSETSKVARLATRELGVQSAIAKGVYRPKSRFGAALEFLAEGDAQLYFRESRELHTLAAFDVANLRRALAADLSRFAAAAALAEVMLKAAPPAPLPAAYDTLVAILDGLAGAAPEAVDAAAVRGLWILVAELGFGPSLETCARDGSPVTESAGPVVFSAAEGGVLCGRCAPRDAPTRLPSADYQALCALADRAGELPPLDSSHAAAHRRLVARFVRYHVGVEALTALDSWERHAWAKLPSPVAL
jgi:DNA repair protein RecO (recombination protein O)